jgi:hypothetical protein
VFPRLRVPSRAFPRIRVRGITGVTLKSCCLRCSASTCCSHLVSTVTGDRRLGCGPVTHLMLSQDEEFGPSTVTDGLQLSDTDSDVDDYTHQRIDSLLRRGTIRHGSVAVTRNTTGQLCVVTQAEDYMHRPEEFKSFSLYEMVCMTYRREISTKTKEPSSSDSGHDINDSSNSSSDEKEQRRGRRTTCLFHFRSPHRLKDTHALALLKRYSVAQNPPDHSESASYTWSSTRSIDRRLEGPSSRLLTVCHCSFQTMGRPAWSARLSYLETLLRLAGYAATFEDNH